MTNIKIIIERLRGGSDFLSRKKPPRGIIARSFEDDIYGRRRADDNNNNDGGGGGGGTVRAAPTLTVNHYRDIIYRSGNFSGYGYYEFHRQNGAYVDTSRPSASSLELEVSMNADFSDPFQTQTLTPGSGSLNSIVCDRRLTCTANDKDGDGTRYDRYALYGTTQYARARDYDGYSWSEWGSVDLVYRDDYSVPDGYPLTYTDRCN